MLAFDERALPTPSVESLDPRRYWDARVARASASAALREPSGEQADLAWLWLELCAGRTRVRELFYSEERCYAVLEPITALSPTRRAMGDRNVTVLERVLLGESQKAVAIDMGLAPSTVTVVVGKCLKRMGVRTGAATAPVLLIMAAQAARGLGVPSGVSLRRLASDGGDGWLLSAWRPDVRSSVALSNAETAILRKVVEGESIAQIAASRNTSRRTIANQFAALFRKFRVSGRAALLGELVSRMLHSEAAEPSRA